MEQHASRRKRVGLAAALTCLLAAGATAQDTAQRILDIDKELQKEMQELQSATREAPDEEAAQAIYDDFVAGVLPEFAERYAAIGRENPGQDAGLDAWTKVVGLAGRGLESPLTREAITTIVRDHLASPKLASFAMGLRYTLHVIPEADALAALRTLGDGSPHREVQAAALYTLGAVLGDERPAGDPRIEEAKKVFTRVAAFSDVKFRGDETYAQAAQTFVFALENLLVGKKCPDFEAIDAEGATFKLSDYAGKVVLIDFWGFW